MDYDSPDKRITFAGPLHDLPVPLYMFVCSKSMNYANVRIAASLPLKCNILIVKTFGTIGPGLLKKASFSI